MSGAPQRASLGGDVKYVSFTLTTTDDTINGWLAGGTDLDTGATVAFSLDNIAQVKLTGYTGTIKYGGSNSQPIAHPANADFTVPSMRGHTETYIEASAGSFTVYAIVIFC
jgi:hypothetical protein